MTDRFVGIGGNDGNSGLTWALRKLTLNGVEDTPVVAGDTVYVGPGVYREMLSCDVSGNGGNPITYIGDVTGENTDEVGGLVRLTGSDDDETVNRNRCIQAAAARDFRTFKSFRFDMTELELVWTTATSDDWIFEDCIFTEQDGSHALMLIDGNVTGWRIKRCIFQSRLASGYQVNFNGASANDDCDIVVENSIFYIGSRAYGLRFSYHGEVIVRNCLFAYGDYGCMSYNTTAGAGQQVHVYNSIFCYLNNACYGAAADDLMEDFCTFWSNGTDRVNVDVGADSETFPPQLLFPLLRDGYIMPYVYLMPTEWSAIRRIAGTSEATDDLYGNARPTTSAKKSWGPVQLREGQRETGTVRGGSDASMNLADAGDHQVFVPVDDTEMTISVYVYREANYAGTNPRMIVRQPGQADDVTTDANAVSQWNLLTTTLTPSSDTGYVIVILRSLNTAAAGNYDVFFDDLQVT